MVLAGGRGTRLWPLTDDRPKGLLPVLGVEFIAYQLELLAKAGVEEVLLAVGRNQEQWWRRYRAARQAAPRLEMAWENTALDTAGPVIGARRRLEDRFLVLNGDVLFEADLGAFIAEAPDTDGVLALTRVEDPSPFGVVVTDEEHRVSAFVEKPPRETAPADTVSAGVYLLRRSVLDDWAPGRRSFERDVFPALASQRRLSAVVVEGAWMDIGKPGLYLDAHAHVAAGLSGLVSPDPEQPHGPGRVDGAVGGAWAFVGEGAMVEQGALVEEAVVLDGARVESGAVVRRAVIGWDAVVGGGATVEEEALVGAGAVVGAGCELGRGVRLAPKTELGPRAVTFTPPA